MLRDQGAAALRRQLAQTRPFVQALFEREMMALDARDTPEAKAGVKARLRGLAARINNRDLSSQYREDLLDRFYEVTQWRKISSRRSSATYAANFISSSNSLQQKLAVRIRRFNALVAIGAIHNPEWALEFIEDIARVGFGDQRMDAVIDPLINALSQTSVSFELVRDSIRKAGASISLAAMYFYAFETSSTRDYTLQDSQNGYQVWLMAARNMFELAYAERELNERAEDRSDLLEAEAGVYIERGGQLRSRFHDLRARTMWHEVWPWANTILEILGDDPSEPLKQWRNHSDEVLAAHEAATSGALTVH